MTDDRSSFLRHFRDELGAAWQELFNPEVIDGEFGPALRVSVSSRTSLAFPINLNESGCDWWLYVPDEGDESVRNAVVEQIERGWKQHPAHLGADAVPVQSIDVLLRILMVMLALGGGVGERYIERARAGVPPRAEDMSDMNYLLMRIYGIRAIAADLDASGIERASRLMSDADRMIGALTS